MRKIIFALLVLCSFSSFAQVVQTSYVVPSIATMKTYFGYANRMHVTANNSDYVICSPCITDEVNTYAGAGGRKWMKVSDSAKASVGGSDSTTASNGLTLVGKDVQLGGNLTSGGINSIYNNGNAFYFIDDNTGATNILGGSVTITPNGSYLPLVSTGNDNPSAIFINNTSVSNQASENLVLRTISASPTSNGIGGSFQFEVQDSSGETSMSNTVKSILTDINTHTLTSQLQISGVYLGSPIDQFFINGNGSIKLNQYGLGAFSGTPAYNLSVDASGNVIEIGSIILYTPSTSTDATYPNGTLSADNTYLYFRKSDGTWVKSLWITF